MSKNKIYTVLMQYDTRDVLDVDFLLHKEVITICVKSNNPEDAERKALKKECKHLLSRLQYLKKIGEIESVDVEILFEAGNKCLFVLGIFLGENENLKIHDNYLYTWKK